MGSESYSPKCMSPMAVKCYPGCTNSNKERTKSKDQPALKKFFCREGGIKNILKLRNCHSKGAPSCGGGGGAGGGGVGASKDSKKNTNAVSLKKGKESFRISFFFFFCFGCFVVLLFMFFVVVVSYTRSKRVRRGSLFGTRCIRTVRKKIRGNGRRDSFHHYGYRWLVRFLWKRGISPALVSQT